MIFAVGRAAFDSLGHATVAAETAASDFNSDLRFIVPPPGKSPGLRGFYTKTIPGGSVYRDTRAARSIRERPPLLTSIRKCQRNRLLRAAGTIDGVYDFQRAKAFFAGNEWKAIVANGGGKIQELALKGL